MPFIILSIVGSYVVFRSYRVVNRSINAVMNGGGLLIELYSIRKQYVTALKNHTMYVYIYLYE